MDGCTENGFAEDVKSPLIRNRWTSPGLMLQNREEHRDDQACSHGRARAFLRIAHDSTPWCSPPQCKHTAEHLSVSLYELSRNLVWKTSCRSLKKEKRKKRLKIFSGELVLAFQLLQESMRAYKLFPQ